MRIALLIGIIALCLMIAGCGAQQETDTLSSTPTEIVGPSGSTSDTAPEIATETAPETPEPEAPASEPRSEPEERTSSVTQEDLDELQQMIEDLDAEDLGGLSEE